MFLECEELVLKITLMGTPNVKGTLCLLHKSWHVIENQPKPFGRKPISKIACTNLHALHNCQRTINRRLRARMQRLIYSLCSCFVRDARAALCVHVISRRMPRAQTFKTHTHAHKQEFIRVTRLFYAFEFINSI